MRKPTITVKYEYYLLLYDFEIYTALVCRIKLVTLLSNWKIEFWSIHLVYP